MLIGQLMVAVDNRTGQPLAPMFDALGVRVFMSVKAGNRGRLGAHGFGPGTSFGSTQDQSHFSPCRIGPASVGVVSGNRHVPTHQSGGVRGAADAGARVPGVHGEVMVVLAPGHEDRAGVVVLGDAELEVIEIGLRVGELGSLQVDVTDVHRCRRSILDRILLGQDGAERQGKTDHLDLVALPGPLVLGLVPGEFDAVSVGVCQIDGPAHGVVCCSVEVQSRHGEHTAQGELPLQQVGKEKRDMEQARSAAGGSRCVLVLQKGDQHGLADGMHEIDGASLSGAGIGDQAQQVGVEGPQRLGIAGAENDPPDDGVGGGGIRNGGGGVHGRKG